MAQLATAEAAFALLEALEDNIDQLMVTLDEHMRDRHFDLAIECGEEIFDLLRARIPLKKFILDKRTKGR